MKSTVSETYIPDVLIYGTTYYWGVVANDGTNTADTAIMSFTVEKESFKDISMGIGDTVLRIGEKGW